MSNEVIEVIITPEDFREARFYADPHKCPLAIALNRLMPDGPYISVGPSAVDIEEAHNRKRYSISSNWGSYDMNPNAIDSLIKQAKESLEGIPTVSVTLELI